MKHTNRTTLDFLYGPKRNPPSQALFYIYSIFPRRCQVVSVCIGHRGEAAIRHPLITKRSARRGGGSFGGAI